MKYVVILADGMADYPIAELGGKTPAQAAFKPEIDRLAAYGEVGMVLTIPTGMTPGSDTANLAVMGYDPAVYYTGRSPFEAVSIGIELADDDVAFRTNVVTLSEDEPYGKKTMLDHSADEITSAEARILMEEVNKRLGTPEFTFYPGVSYRHILIWNKAPYDYRLTPPHDIIGREIGEYLPGGPYGRIFLKMMEESSSFLKDHPVNRDRIARGLRPANSIWIWGEGKRPALSDFYEKYQLKGSVISAVDLIKGLGICAGLRSIDVEGATGNIHTNFAGKAQAAVNELKDGQDFVYVHLEAPDECGHRFEMENKVKSIEYIDSQVVKPIIEGLEKMGEDYSLMLLPDHPTPLALRTHTAEPVPYLIYRSTAPKASPGQVYDEFYPSKTGNYYAEGYRLMDHFLQDR
ncbi:MAG: cofactor-independent phosphoglycerate mutase [Candidatus Omnitrophica bacterium]|nr:cofactor-independent phosphoglycerate mutase [Candidatus Omnitrophota bacterium]